jgi:hypothetical protein
MDGSSSEKSFSSLINFQPDTENSFIRIPVSSEYIKLYNIVVQIINILTKY